MRRLWLCLLAVCVSASLAHAAPSIYSTPYDTIPNFAANPTIIALADGPWCTPATWSPARVPISTDIVEIAGHTILYDCPSSSALVVGISAGGVLRFSRLASTQLAVGTLLIAPGGTLEVGTVADPIPAGVVAELIVRDIPHTLATDPSQYGTGLLALDGTLSMVGAAKVSTFLRVGAELPAGAAALPLSASVVGWLPGDELLLPDSRHLTEPLRTNYVPHAEVHPLASLAGQTATLATPLLYAHPGAHSSLIPSQVDFLPHVANLTRNVRIRSENPAGTRGHIFLTGLSHITMQYVSLAGLGRTRIDPLDNTVITGGVVTHVGTNQTGRYALHLHHVRDAYNLKGLVVRQARKWGITLHDTHYGQIVDTVGYDMQGWFIGNEEGNESFNTIRHNLGVLITGTGQRPDARAGNAIREWGHEGACYWWRGVNNIFDDNVCANAIINPGIMVYNDAIAAHVPAFLGADTSVPGQFVLKDTTKQAPISFRGNEVYAGMGGMSLWNLGAQCCNDIPLNAPLSTIKDQIIWHTSSYAHYGYGMSNVLFDHWVHRGDPQVLLNPNESAGGIFFGDYLARKIEIRNADIQGASAGIILPSKPGDTRDAYGTAPGEILIKDGLISASVGILRYPLWGVTGGGSVLPPARATVDNVRFVKPPTLSAYKSIDMHYETGFFHENMLQTEEVIVKNYQQQLGNDFRAYYTQQAGSFIIPPTGGDLSVGSPLAGATNAQLWAQFGVAFAGSVAPCEDKTTRPEIAGFTCGSVPLPDTTAPSAPTGLRLTDTTSTELALAWVASTDNVGVTGYRVSRGGATLTTVLGTTYRDTGLQPSTSYTYTVQALDAAGNISAFSAPMIGTTLPPAFAPLNALLGLWARADGTILECTARGASALLLLQAIDGLLRTLP